jgi:Flp pilus assembly protein TadG
MTRNKSSNQMHNKKITYRNQRGSLGTMLFLCVLLFIMGLGAFGIDIGHVAAIRHQLQNAVDAAAIAGAMDLSTDPTLCESDAIAVAKENRADNCSVLDGAGPMDVKVAVKPCTPTAYGTVTVTASMRINHLFAPIFGGFSSELSATAVAGAAGKLTGMYGNGAFPMAVSMDSLEGLGNGDSVTWYLNSQQYKNAAFTSLTEKSANANWLNNAIAEMLGLPAKTDVNIPSVSVGDTIYLTNGIDGQKQLADDPYFGALMNQEIIFLPVIQDQAPYNQTAKVIGFIGVQFTNISKASKNGIVETMVATIKMPMTEGMSMDQMPKTGNPTWDTSLNGFAPGVVKLIR